jgi:hypothetical protein
MVNLVLLYLGAAFTAIWGISHLFPTRSVVKGVSNSSRKSIHIYVKAIRDLDLMPTTFVVLRTFVLKLRSCHPWNRTSSHPGEAAEPCENPTRLQDRARPE